MARSKRTNTAYLLKLMLPGVFALMVAGGQLVGHGSTLRAIWFVVPACLVIPLVILVVVRQRTHRAFERLLQAESPAALIAWNRAHVVGIADSDVYAAYGSTLAAIYYGEFAAARRLLADVRWEGRAPLVAACEPHAQALLALFDERDTERAAALAQRAIELGDVHPAFPGAATSRRAFASALWASRVLGRTASPDDVAGLEETQAKAPLLGKLLAATALSVAYVDAGRADDAARMRAFVQTKAPHCRALLTAARGVG